MKLLHPTTDRKSSGRRAVRSARPGAGPVGGTQEVIAADGRPREASNGRVKLAPAVEKLAPAGEKLAPAGEKLAPAGEKLAPAGVKLEPAGVKLAPAGVKLAPAGMKLAPAA
ncbi:unnamed protein product [Gadus morhua 'NCC']